MASLTVTQLLARATEVLNANGYTEVPSTADTDLRIRRSRVFEDAYGIVALHGFDTWRQLADQWHLAQGQLVDLISTHLRTPEPKAWEGYLVLLTPGLVQATDRVALNDLRNDTIRVRKLIATGEDLGTLDDVRGALLPLLPLSIDGSQASSEGLLELLPGMLEEADISRDVTEVVVGAFAANESILERLHAFRTTP
jgi:hypothetical protein